MVRPTICIVRANVTGELPGQDIVLESRLTQERLKLPTHLDLHVIKNLAAVCLGSGLLALAHSDPYGPDWIAGIAYPVIAVSCFATTISLYAIRFRRHVSDTHEARWRSRR